MHSLCDPIFPLNHKPQTELTFQWRVYAWLPTWSPGRIQSMVKLTHTNRMNDRSWHRDTERHKRGISSNSESLISGARCWRMSRRMAVSPLWQWATLQLILDVKDSHNPNRLRVPQYWHLMLIRKHTLSATGPLAFSLHPSPSLSLLFLFIFPVPLFLTLLPTPILWLDTFSLCLYLSDFFGTSLKQTHFPHIFLSSSCY